MLHQDKPTSFYDHLSQWFESVKKHELTSFIELVEQAKVFAEAAESIPEEKVSQFVDNFKQDLREFSTLTEQQLAHSIYLGLLKEQFWQTMADITDRTQVEWAELDDDFKHHGHYHEGDYIGFGQLTCTTCSLQSKICHFSKIGACPKCAGTEFIRSPLSP